MYLYQKSPHFARLGTRTSKRLCSLLANKGRDEVLGFNVFARAPGRACFDESEVHIRNMYQLLRTIFSVMNAERTTSCLSHAAT